MYQEYLNNAREVQLTEEQTKIYQEMLRMQKDYANQPANQEKDITQDPKYKQLEARQEQIEKELDELNK